MIIDIVVTCDVKDGVYESIDPQEVADDFCADPMQWINDNKVEVMYGGTVERHNDVLKAATEKIKALQADITHDASRGWLYSRTADVYDYHLNQVLSILSQTDIRRKISVTSTEEQKKED